MNIFELINLNKSRNNINFEYNNNIKWVVVHLVAVHTAVLVPLALSPIHLPPDNLAHNRVRTWE